MHDIAKRAPRCPVAHDFDPFDGMAHEFFRRARRERPIFDHPELDAFVLTRDRDCERILKAGSDEVSATAALAPNVEPIPEEMAILGKDSAARGASSAGATRRRTSSSPSPGAWRRSRSGRASSPTIGARTAATT